MCQSCDCVADALQWFRGRRREGGEGGRIGKAGRGKTVREGGRREREGGER